MQVTVKARTPRRLDIRLRPVTTWAYWLGGVVFIVAGVWSGLTLGRATQLQCRAFGIVSGCELALSNGIGWTRRSIPAADLLGAQREIRRNIISASSVVVMKVRGGDVELPLVSADGDRMDTVATQINAFAQDPSRPDVDVREDMRVIGWLFGITVVIAGVMCILAIERVRIVLDGDRGKVKITRAKLLGIRRDEFDLARLERVEKNEFTFKQTRSWAVTLILDEGEVPLTRTPLFTHHSANQVTTLITGWMA